MQPKQTWHDTDSGLGIGGINNDQSMPIIPRSRPSNVFSA